MLARASLTALFLVMPYVRSGGLGAKLVEASRSACGIAILLSALLCFVFGMHGVLALACAVLVFWLWRRACMHRLGGFTGDTAGALAEMIEMVVLVVLAASA